MNEVDFSKVGLKMKQLRSERGITQEQVAKDLNCSFRQQCREQSC